MVKLILPIELAAEIEPHLPSDTKFVRVDNDGNFDGDASDAEVYLNGFKLKPTTLHTALPAAMRYILKAESYDRRGVRGNLYCITDASAVRC